MSLIQIYDKINYETIVFKLIPKHNDIIKYQVDYQQEFSV